jgi:hypothetical protein
MWSLASTSFTSGGSSRPIVRNQLKSRSDSLVHSFVAGRLSQYADGPVHAFRRVDPDGEHRREHIPPKRASQSSRSGVIR